jgi:hypothetical protein
MEPFFSISVPYLAQLEKTDASLQRAKFSASSTKQDFEWLLHWGPLHNRLKKSVSRQVL